MRRRRARAKKRNPPWLGDALAAAAGGGAAFVAQRVVFTQVAHPVAYWATPIAAAAALGAAAELGLGSWAGFAALGAMGMLAGEASAYAIKKYEATAANKALVGKQVKVPVGQLKIIAGSQFVTAPPADAIASVTVNGDDGTTGTGQLVSVASSTAVFTPPTATTVTFPDAAVITGS